uniref:Uncharacterized protein n=1 Tax=Arundo donax TaxID=35708 RepID=A0A0A8YQT3_ARUDO
MDLPMVRSHAMCPSRTPTASSSSSVHCTTPKVVTFQDRVAAIAHARE